MITPNKATPKTRFYHVSETKPEVSSKPGVVIRVQLKNFSFSGFFCICEKLAKPATLTFEINGHGASLRCYCDGMLITGWSLINLANHERILLHRR